LGLEGTEDDAPEIKYVILKKIKTLLRRKARRKVGEGKKEREPRWPRPRLVGSSLTLSVVLAFFASLFFIRASISTEISVNARAEEAQSDVLFISSMVRLSLTPFESLASSADAIV